MKYTIDCSFILHRNAFVIIFNEMTATSI